MKVCLISGEYPPMQGGVGDYTHKLGEALATLGIEVSVVTSARARRQEASKQQAAGSPPPASCLVHPLIEKWDWDCWRRITSIAHDRGAEILHIQYQAAAFGMHPAINLLPWRLRLSRERPATAVTFHDLRVPYLFPKAGRVRWWAILALGRYSDAVIVTNPQDWDRLSTYGWMRSLHLVPIGSNIAPAPPPGYDRARWRMQWGDWQRIRLCWPTLASSAPARGVRR